MRSDVTVPSERGKVTATISASESGTYGQFTANSGEYRLLSVTEAPPALAAILPTLNYS